MLETIASGYGLLEGPRVDDTDNLYFSDVTNGGVYCRAPGGELSTVVPRRRGVGGIALHAAGGLVISGKNVCHVKDGTTRILFQRDDIPGFNDLFTDSQGRVLVGSLRSDPFKLKVQIPGELWRLAGEDSAALNCTAMLVSPTALASRRTGAGSTIRTVCRGILSCTMLRLTG